jgi:Ca2+/H+ antiporter, TMEM165/GDT1 family
MINLCKYRGLPERKNILSFLPSGWLIRIHWTMPIKIISPVIFVCRPRTAIITKVVSKFLEDIYLDALLASFLFVVLAEMGDKTQLLAMAFATRFSAVKVLIAVFLATVLNHALAVIVGHYLTEFIPLDIISLVAALSFILFGLWTLKGDSLKGEDKKTSRFGPIVTVAIAFFLAEMGDKTQLATISLAVQYNNMIFVLMGTTLGMIVADSIGITIGIVLKKRMPNRLIKWFSAAIFAIFGFVGVYNVISQKLAGSFVFLIFTILIGLTALAAYYLLKKRNSIGVE